VELDRASAPSTTGTFIRPRLTEPAIAPPSTIAPPAEKAPPAVDERKPPGSEPPGKRKLTVADFDADPFQPQ
jgi:hypothetical protein